MPNKHWNQLLVRPGFLVQFTALLVGMHGVFLLASVLVEQLAIRHSGKGSFAFDLPLLIGLSLIYLSSRLLRGKRTAWVAAVVAYIFLLGLYTLPFLLTVLHKEADPDRWAREVALPLIILGLLYTEHARFVVRSDLAIFRSSLKFAAIILSVAFLYGTSGFLLLDNHDFHSEISITEAMHRTVDQFDLTTNHPLQPHTRRAQVFLDSLSVVSTGAVVYVIISLFQPLRARLQEPAHGRQIMTELLRKHHALSEDFFKLWPHDKQYYFNPERTAGVAFHVYRGVALCIGDPIGDTKGLHALMNEWEQLCFLNDWLPAFIHTEHKLQRLYNKHDYTMQKIGQEAVVNIDNYTAQVSDSKYFRHIRNRFNRENYTAELLEPPHHSAVIERLKIISDEWLSRPGRVERGFVMGYFTNEYMQLCPVLVAKDAAGTIQGFINQIPANFDKNEATFDMLRQTNNCLGNTNDFLLMNFIEVMRNQGFRRVNLGLSPLVGLDDSDDESKSIVDNFLSFAYANGDRVYSFSGLHRFKAKYQPEWRDRYIIYKGGVRGFARTMNALLKVMQIKNLKN